MWSRICHFGLEPCSQWCAAGLSVQAAQSMSCLPQVFALGQVYLVRVLAGDLRWSTARRAHVWVQMAWGWLLQWGMCLLRWAVSAVHVSWPLQAWHVLKWVSPQEWGGWGAFWGRAMRWNIFLVIPRGREWLMENATRNYTSLIGSGEDEDYMAWLCILC